MVKHCSHGTCSSDSRYPDKLRGAKFIPFAKPKSDLQKCMRWIALCRRPHSQLRVHKITKHTYICSKHFITLDGPTEEYPDPRDAKTGELKKVRRSIPVYSNKRVPLCTGVAVEPPLPSPLPMQVEQKTCDVACQTEEQVYSSLDMLAYAAWIQVLQDENERLLKDIAQRELIISQRELAMAQRGLAQRTSNKTLRHQKSSTVTKTNFNAADIAKSKIKNLFQFYTGLTYNRFLMLLTFLFPAEDQNPIVYENQRRETHINISPLSQQVFMYLCRLRNGFNVKDLAYRFNINVQTVSTVLTGVVRYMYLRLGSLSYWPHRNLIVQNMTSSYRSEFPTCIAIIDCTEIKTEKPSSLQVQSQCFSDYKSANTLKSLVVCDPRGSIMFVSDLFSGSISDNEICEQCGFYQYLQNLKQRGFLQDGDAIMADKGFRIEKELSNLNINLNIPPFASSSKPFSEVEVQLTRKIAAHRIHIEPAINRNKCFKLFKHRIPISLFHCINENWVVAALLTNFQETLVKC